MGGEVRGRCRWVADLNGHGRATTEGLRVGHFLGWVGPVGGRRRITAHPPGQSRTRPHGPNWTDRFRLRCLFVLISTRLPHHLQMSKLRRWHLMPPTSDGRPLFPFSTISISIHLRYSDFVKLIWLKLIPTGICWIWGFCAADAVRAPEWAETVDFIYCVDICTKHFDSLTLDHFLCRCCWPISGQPDRH